MARPHLGRRSSSDFTAPAWRNFVWVEEGFPVLSFNESSIPSPNSKILRVRLWTDVLQVSLWEPSLAYENPAFQRFPLQDLPLYGMCMLTFKSFCALCYIKQIKTTCVFLLLNFCCSILCSVYIPLYLSFLLLIIWGLVQVTPFFITKFFVTKVISM